MRQHLKFLHFRIVLKKFFVLISHIVQQLFNYEKGSNINNSHMQLW